MDCDWVPTNTHTRTGGQPPFLYAKALATSDDAG